MELYRQLTGGVNIRTQRDRFGREIRKNIRVDNAEKSSKQYQWGIGNKLQAIHNELTGAMVNFDYDAFDNLIKADYDDFGKQTETIYRVPDAIGNLYQTSGRNDRKYGKGGRLLEDPNYYYHYDVEGNLFFKEFKKPKGFSSIGKEAIEKKYKIKFRGSATGWLYDWSANGMLSKVVNPQQGKVRFGYDAFGRRTFKEVKGKRVNWLWDGNVPLHEWESYSTEALVNIVTWIFEGGFVPCAKVTADTSYSIVTDYLGTPTQMFDDRGTKTWDAELDIYGKMRSFGGGSLSDCPFRYQGQYQDGETGLYYNHFRYYDPELGNYISKDPIGLAGGLNVYAYVHDSNTWIDPLGLSGIIYLRTDPYTGKQYVGKSKNIESYNRRQSAHNSALNKANPKGGQKYDFEVLQDNISGKKNLSLAEENWIRDKGGIAKDGGPLENKIHAMADKKYKDAGPLENKIHAMADKKYKDAGGTKNKVKTDCH